MKIFQKKTKKEEKTELDRQTDRMTKKSLVITAFTSALITAILIGSFILIPSLLDPHPVNEYKKLTPEIVEESGEWEIYYLKDEKTKQDGTLKVFFLHKDCLVSGPKELVSFYNGISYRYDEVTNTLIPKEVRREEE